MTRLLGRPTRIGGSVWSLSVHASVIAAVLVLESSGVNIQKVVFSGNTQVVPMAVELHLATELSVPRPSVELPVARQAEFTVERLEPDAGVTDRLTRDVGAPVVEIGVPLQPGERSTKSESELSPSVSEPDPQAFPFGDRAISGPASALPQRELSPSRERTLRDKLVPHRDLEHQPAVSQPHRVGTEDRTSADLAGNRPPPYPAAAYRARIEGSLLLRLTISAAGEVKRVELVRSSGHSILDVAAVRAIRTWHASPARAGGRAVSSVELLPVRFRLRPAISR
ncbi:MAG: energy transducer TonB [Pirellulales bacterium]